MPGCSCHMGGCQNYGPFLGTLNNRCRIIIGTEKGTLILTTTHIFAEVVPDQPTAFVVGYSLQHKLNKNPSSFQLGLQP